FSSDVITSRGKRVHLNLVANPSHLEAVDPVVEGVVRAKIDKRYLGDENKIVPILIHGDAAIAGQGVVYEVIQMSLLEGYRTGGTVHMVLNNQIGFTTNYLDARSSVYCTDVAKVTLSPVFHVNADDVEAVIFTVLMALEYRQRFHTDVFIDLLGYRRYGHNEADEPRFTQPRLYKIIEKHPDPREIYYRKLLESGSVERGIAEEMDREYRRDLQRFLQEAREQQKVSDISSFRGDWEGFRRPVPEDFLQSPETGVAETELLQIGERVFTIPEEFHAFDKIRKLYDERRRRLLEQRELDWGMAETLAYGTLLKEGVPVRISGQDCERGTFAHRHAVLIAEDTEEEYVPLRHVADNQAPFYIYNSLLSEYGVLGFEYGYASAHPKGLTIWEAQFGDFANGAQIIIDQFISSSAVKWKRYHGLVMFLPHGYEGQGPEHSSARIERFLDLCSYNDLNMLVVNCTTPANFFHVLRRQMAYPFRVPLVVFTPKSLLRHPRVVSPVKEFGKGTRFQEVIDDPYIKQPGKVRRLLFCSGKIYYDLQARQEKEKRRDVAIVRLEQLHPLPLKQVQAIIDKYKNVERYFWVQEEPENMGPWPYIRRKFKLARTTLISRAESATPATGIYRQHVREQEEIVNLAFAEETESHLRKVARRDIEA
ncbi:MAG: 2-oxoglutarate dehydrogenase E1 component, partial [Calditrichaeota bacterium]